MPWSVMLWLACQPTVRTELPPPPEPAPVAREAVPYEPGASYREELATLGQRIDYFEAKSDLDPAGPPTAQAADLLLDRARLTGAFDDAHRALERLDRAFEVRADHPGARASRARLHLSYRRYDQAKSDLEGIRWQERLHARIALERGDLADAAARLEKLASSNKAEDLVQLARLHVARGDDDAALQALHEAERRYKGAWNSPLAEIHLLRADLALSKGQLDDAAKHVEAADGAMRGAPTVALRRAELAVRRDAPAEAQQVLEASLNVVRLPATLEALARATAAQGGDTEPSRASARAAWEAQLAEAPEATWGPLARHHLFWGDAEAALPLAEQDHRNRPCTEATLTLARALHGVGRQEEARRLLSELHGRLPEAPGLADARAALGQ